MLISIDQSALEDADKRFLFRSGTLHALRVLTDGGRELLLDKTKLSEEQERMLEQEAIEYRSDSKPDYTVQASAEDAARLQLLDKMESVFEAESWDRMAQYLIQHARKTQVHRRTNETDIRIDLNLDGTGVADIKTGLNFFDHMLDQIARHGLVDLTLRCEGDLEIDEHHTIEDTAIALGEAISEALGDKKGIERYGFVLPMDETQARVAIDLSGRPYLVFDGSFKREYVGDFPTEMVKHFFYSLAMNLRATIHVSFEGENDHHKIEACFKGLARALKMAIERNGRIKHLIPSSKGTL